MSLLDILRRAFRSLLSAKARTLLTAFAIAVGAFALTLTLAASNGANNYANTIIKDNFDPSELIVSASPDLFSTTDTTKPQEYSPNVTSVISQAGSTAQIESLDDDDIETLKSVPGVESIRTNSTQTVSYITRDGQRKYSATVQTYSMYKAPELLAGSVAELSDTSVAIPEGFLDSLGFASAQDAIGKTIRVAVQQRPDTTNLLSSLLSGNSAAAVESLNDSSKIIEKQYKVIAVTKAPSVLVQPGAELYVTVSSKTINDLADIATMGTDNYRKYLTVYVKVKDGNDSAKLLAVQNKIKNLGYGAQSVADTQKIISQVIAVLQGIVLVFGLIAVIASVFGVVNTMYISVLQRTREIGLMKALGMRRRSINTLFLVEAGLLGFLGGLIGSLFGFVVGSLLNPTISKQLDIGDARMLDFQLPQIIGLIVALAFVAMLAGVLPARKAGNLDPIEALRTE